jgi:hypothetical protein
MMVIMKIIAVEIRQSAGAKMTMFFEIKNHLVLAG